MRAWPAPHVPAIPGRGHALRLYDRRSGRPWTTGGPATASVAVAGSLPEGGLRLGDLAGLVAVDLTARAWRDAGLAVTSVLHLGEAPGTRTEADVADLLGQMAALGVLPPDLLTGTADAAPAVAEALARLLAEGRVEPHDAGAGEEVDVRTADGDAVVWRGERPDGPAWDAGSLDRGRPSPELAAAVQIADHLGGRSDLLAGVAGARTEVVESLLSHMTGRERPVQRILATMAAAPAGHGAEAGADPQKPIARLLEGGVPPTAIRLLVLARRYRSGDPYPASAVDDAVARLERWTAAVSGNGAPPAEDVVAQVRAALADDLDSPRALAAVDAWAALSLGSGQPGGVPESDLVEGAPGVVARAVDALLGVRL